MLRHAPAIALAVLAGPILFGFAATLVPAFGYLPALGGEAITLDPFRELFAEPGIWHSVQVSFLSGIVTTAISLALVATFFAAWSGTRTFARIQHLVSPLLSIPHAAAAFGIAFLIAPSGLLMRVISPELTGLSRPPDLQIVNDPWGISMMIGLVAKEVPFLFLVALAAMPQARPREYLQVASGLGYGRMSGFILGVWPNVYRQVRLAVFAVIAYSSSVVDVALILGPTNPAPLAVRLVEWMSHPDLAMRFKASAGALLQLAVTTAAILAWVGIERLAVRIAAGISGSGRRLRRDRPLQLASAAVMTLSAAMVLAGLAGLALWSVAGYWAFPDALPQGFTFRTWEQQLQSVARPFTITLLLGLAVTLLAVIVVLACLEGEARSGRKAGDRALLFIYLPLLVPQPAFVFGLQLFFLLLGMSASLAALILVHLVFVLPYVFLSLSDPWRAWDRRYAMVALSMGSSPSRVFWRIRFPMLLRAVLAAAAIGFAVSIGQYLPTILIGAGRWPTLTTEAVALASGGDRRVIGVYAFLQMLLPLAGFVIAALIPSLLLANRRAMRASA